MGNPPPPFLAALIISRANFGFFIKAAPARCFSTDLSGQPILISRPSNFNFLQRVEAFLIFSGFDPNICAIIGLSFSPYLRLIKSLFLPIEHRPSAETNSVQKTSGWPYLAMICRKAQSVTSAIGAKQKIGFLILSQKFRISRICNISCCQNEGQYISKQNIY